MCSKLFVFGICEELFVKVFVGFVDVVFIDLEDVVFDICKDEVCVVVGCVVCSMQVQGSGKLFIVCVNLLGLLYFEVDFCVILVLVLDFVNLFKVEGVVDVFVVVQVMDVVGLFVQVWLFVNIEILVVFCWVVEIVVVYEWVVGLQLGLGDLFEFVGIDWCYVVNVYVVMFLLSLVVVEVGVYCCDGVFVDFKDEVGFCVEVGMVWLLGFIGKSCIYLSQVVWVNEIFELDVGEIE